MSDKLRSIQLCQLDMLKEIVRICDKYGIQYWLAYGTMLGAVRHKGFIPWDDDLDIYMTMEGFKKFEKICRKDLKDGYFLQTPESEPTMGWLYFKMRKNGTQMLERNQSADDGRHYGIWVDIFPLINFSDDENKQNKQFALLKKLQILRGYHPVVRKTKKLKDCAKLIYSKIVRAYELFLWKQVKALGKNGGAYKLGIENEFYPHCTNSGMRKKIFDNKLFLNTEKYLFEDEYFCGIADFDVYLTQCYSNDYMTPKKYNAHTDDYLNVIV